MRKLLLALLATTVAGTALAAPAAEAKSVCKRPTALSFERKPGAAGGRLSWKRPGGAPRGTRYRVYRDRDVIGQTRGRSMRIRVSLGRAYRLSVRVVAPSGRPLPCSAGIRKRVTYVLPSTPRHFAVEGASAAAAHLSWTASRRGDAQVTAYRVLRNGVTFRQVRDTSVDVPLANNRAYRFEVAAVDAHGKLSALAGPVTIASGQQPPPAPATVLATEVTDSAVTLSWSPSQPARGSVAAYRIYRDGKTVRQVAGLSTRITNLAAGASHEFTVAAVDQAGWLSTPSAPARVTVAPPIPSTGTAHAFLLASTDRSFADFRANYRQIGVVNPTYFDCTPNAELAGRDDPLITGWAQRRGVKVLPRFNCQRAAVLSRILNEPALRQRWLDELVATVQRNGYDGVNIDFETGYASDRSAFTSFIAELAQRLHADGRVMSIAVSPKTADVANHPRSTFFDYDALSQHADWIFVMAWGLHWSTSAPGPMDEIDWVRRVVGYIDTLPQKRRFVLGTPLYGMDWPNGGGPSNPSTALEHAGVQDLIARVGATPRFDPVSDSWTFEYRDANGVHHEVWYGDAGTRHTRIQLARDNGLGIGFWRLGDEDQRMWSDPLLNP